MISAQQLQKSFSPEEIVLKAVNFSLAPGELIGLIGVSGSGKTVLARCLTGLEPFDFGEVRVESITFGPATDPDDSIFADIRRIVGFVTQNRALPPYRTVIDLVSEGPRYVLGLTRGYALEVARKQLTDLGLARHLGKYPPELSGGQLSRLCLARALVMQPKYLICDEVTANLDPVRAAEVSLVLLNVLKTGVGILFISHQLEFIRQFATRVDFLDGGEIVASGKPVDVFREPRHDSLKKFLESAFLSR
jgi:ABC-type polar amino acid transport system ATPase subunit